MRKWSWGLPALLLCAGMAVAGGEHATPKEAEAMVKKAVAEIKVDRDKAFTQISDPHGPFVDRDLYIVVYNKEATCLAHGFNAKFIGKNFMDLRDADGKEYWRERVSWAQTKPSFWQDLKFVNPISRKIEPKTTYCERLNDLIVCGGAYKT